MMAEVALTAAGKLPSLSACRQEWAYKSGIKFGDFNMECSVEHKEVISICQSVSLVSSERNLKNVSFQQKSGLEEEDTENDKLHLDSSDAGSIVIVPTHIALADYPNKTIPSPGNLPGPIKDAKPLPENEFCAPGPKADMDDEHTPDGKTTDAKVVARVSECRSEGSRRVSRWDRSPASEISTRTFASETPAQWIAGEPSITLAPHRLKDGFNAEAIERKSPNEEAENHLMHNAEYSHRDSKQWDFSFQKGRDRSADRRYRRLYDERDNISSRVARKGNYRDDSQRKGSDRYYSRNSYERSRSHDRRNEISGYAGRNGYTKRSDHSRRQHDGRNNRDYEYSDRDGRYRRHSSEHRSEEHNASGQKVHYNDDSKSHNIPEEPKDLNQEIAPANAVEIAAESADQGVEDASPDNEEGQLFDGPPQDSIGWIYYDLDGNCQGPMDLEYLQYLYESETLQNDHMVNRLGTNEWITLESVVRSSTSGQFSHTLNSSAYQFGKESFFNATTNCDFKEAVPLERHEAHSKVKQEISSCCQVVSRAVLPFEDLHIDERVENLMQNYTLIPGKEKEIVNEALMVAGHSSTKEGDAFRPWRYGEFRIKEDGFEVLGIDIDPMHANAERPTVTDEWRHNMLSYDDVYSAEGTWRWTSRGGDWKLVQFDNLYGTFEMNTGHEKGMCRKLVLNEGHPLCDFMQLNSVDPRKHFIESSLQTEKMTFVPPRWASKAQTVRNIFYPSSKLQNYKMFQTDVLEKPQKAPKSNNKSMSNMGKYLVSNKSTMPSGKLKCHPRKVTQNPSKDHIVLPTHGNDSAIEQLTGKPMKRHEQDAKGGICHPKESAFHVNIPTSEVHGKHVGQSPIIHDLGCSGSMLEPVANLEEHQSRQQMMPTSTNDSEVLKEGTIQANANIADIQDLYKSSMSFACTTLQEYVIKHYKNQVIPATLTDLLDMWLSGKKYNTGPTIESTVAHSSTLVPHGKTVVNTKHHKVEHVPVGANRDSGSQNHGVRPVSTNSSKRVVKHVGINDDEKLKCQKKRRLEQRFNSEALPQGCKMTCSDNGESAPVPMEVDTVLNTECDDKPIAPSKMSWGNLEKNIIMSFCQSFQGDLKSILATLATCRAWHVAVKEFLCKKVEFLDCSSLNTRIQDRALEAVQVLLGSQCKVIILNGCTLLSPEGITRFLQHCPFIIFVEVRGCSHLRELKSRFLNVKWSFDEGADESVASESALSVNKVVRCKMKGNDAHARISGIKRLRLLHSEENHDEVAEQMDLDAADSTGTEHEVESILQHDDVKQCKLHTCATSSKDASENEETRSCKRGANNTTISQSSSKKVKTSTSKKLFKPTIIQRPSHAINCQRMRIGKTSSVKVRDEVPIELQSLLHKKIGNILKVLMSHDKKSLLKTCGQGHAESEKSMNLAIIEHRLEKGSYSAGKIGFDAFETDIFRILRRLLSSAENTPEFPFAKDLFRVAFNLFFKFKKAYFPTNLNNSIVQKPSSKKQHGKAKGQKSDNAAMRKGFGNNIQKGKCVSGKKRRGLDETHWSDSETETSDEDVGEHENDGLHGSDTEMESGSEGFNCVFENDDIGEILEFGSREWGARMTKASMVPPITRKYTVVDDYCIVIGEDLVRRKMRVELPDDYEEKLKIAREKRGCEYSHLDVPEIKDYRPRKKLGDEVIEQEVYGIEPYTHNLLLDTMPDDTPITDLGKQQFIEDKLLCALNKEVKHYTGSKAPMEHSLESVVQRIHEDAKESQDMDLQVFCHDLRKNMKSRPKEKYVAYRKGLGVVCNKPGGFEKDDFVVEFLGEVYPAWRWFEKQDGIRCFQKKEREPAPEFYNIFLERPKGDAAGYDLVVVDAMHKANYASRICHSCRPNCEAKVTAVNNSYTIGVYTLRNISFGEELTFDYNSVTESKEEYNSSICLCGSHGCRGSYLNLAGAETFQEVMKEHHGILQRHKLLLQACTDPQISPAILEEMKQAGVGDCMLSGLPDWLVKYTSLLVKFIEFERVHLPEELIKGNRKRRKEAGAEAFYELDRLDAEVQADGVHSQRLQNLAITLDKVRHVLSNLFEDPRKAPSPLKKVEGKELIARVWKGDNSMIDELLRCLEVQLSKEKLIELKKNIQDHYPVGSVNGLKSSLLWLRDELLKLSSTVLCRHDAAADVIHMYAYTECFFTSEDYGTYQSPTLEITALDLGKQGSGSYTWNKTYGKDYVLGQLINWEKQNAEPGTNLSSARKGCLVLPDLSSCYAKNQQDFQRAYGKKHRMSMFRTMERRPEKQWPKEFWEFKSNRGLYGSPMFDAIQKGTTVNTEMIEWLKTRNVDFVGPYDDQ